MYANRVLHPTAFTNSPPPLTDIEAAILHTVAYVDFFNYPLTAVQVHRYLEGVRATLAEVTAVLTNDHIVPRRLSRQDGYFTLPGREAIVALRREREAVSRQLWPQATRYGRLLAHLPFVRMVAVTGSLTMNNATSDADVDYLVVTEHGRLWLCRAFIIALVRLARREQIELCPNYILSENALEFPDPNLYIAHEIAQMVPLSGLDVYRRLRQINAWTDIFLPNAAGSPEYSTNVAPSHWQKWAELPLRTPIGRWLEQWEMNRKIQKLQIHETGSTETKFGPDVCKGHFDAYKTPTMKAYRTKLHSLR